MNEVQQARTVHPQSGSDVTITFHNHDSDND